VEKAELITFLNQPLLPYEMTEEDGKTAVEILAEKGDTSTMDAFIQRGADITKCVHLTD
jgi:hypothetical protein